MPKNTFKGTRSSREKKKKSNKKLMKKIIFILMGILCLLLIGTSVYAYNLYHSVKKAANQMYEPVSVPANSKKSVKKKTTNNKSKHPKPISILLMGVDQRPHDVGRSDTLIVMTLNPETHQMKMVSIPRDTRVNIPGNGTNKINAAYAYGGPSLAIQTVKQYLNVPINYYIRVNMQGLTQLVNAVGGVRVYNNLSWHEFGYFYHKGWLNLDGKHALTYVRMRHQDPRGDFGRNQRQRKVIKAVINKSAGFSSVSHYQSILDAMSANIRTNLTFENMKYIAKNYRKCRKHVSNYEVKGQGTMINGIYYLLVSHQEVNKVHYMIMDQLNER